MIWYLYLKSNGHCVIASELWHDGAVEPNTEAPNVSQYFFCAPCESAPGKVALFQESYGSAIMVDRVSQYQ